MTFKMKNPIKAAISWLYSDGIAGIIIGSIAVIFYSAMVGYYTNSLWLGLFTYPLTILGILGLFLILGVCIGVPLYVLIVILPKLSKRLKEWAQSN